MARIMDVRGGSPDQYYAITDRLTTTCLREGKSLLTGEELWTAGIAGELRARVIDAPDESGSSFDEKLTGQVQDADPPTRLLAAELRLLQLLPIHDLAPEKKKGKIELLLPVGQTLPDEIAPALSPGVARWGAGHAQAWYQFSYLIRFVEALGELEKADRASVVDDPWRFKELAFGLNDFGAHMQREALLFVAHPDTFDAVFNASHKDAIVAAFSEQAAEQEDRDRALLAIREAMSAELGDNFSWYRPDVAERWKPPKVVKPQGGATDAVQSAPDSELDRRRLRVASWVEQLQAWYDDAGLSEELALPSPELRARLEALPEQLLLDDDADRAVMDSLGNEQASSVFKRGAFRIFIASFLNEGGREARELFADVLSPPQTLSEAESRLRRLNELSARVGSARGPLPSNGLLVLTNLWSLQAPERFPPFWWGRQRAVLVNLGWLPPVDDWVERVVTYLQLVPELNDELWLAGHAISNVAGKWRFLGLDPSLGARAAENISWATGWGPRDGYEDPKVEPRALANIEALVGELRNAASSLIPGLEEYLDSKLRANYPKFTLTDASPYRGDAFLSLTARGLRDEGSFRVWVTADGIWVGALLPQLESDLPDGLQAVAPIADATTASTRFDPLEEQHRGRVLIGRRFSLEDALGDRGLLDRIGEVAGEVAPILQRVWGISSEPPTAREPAPVGGADDLARAVERWRAATGYPTVGDRAELDHLDDLTRRLAPARLDTLDEQALRDLVQAPQQGVAPNAEAFLRELRSVSGEALERLGRTVHHLLWSGEPLARRFDAVHGKADGLGFPGLGGALLRRMLSRAPDGWLPILDLQELLDHAERLGADIAGDDTSSLGTRHAAIDAALQSRLEPWFGTDTAAMAAFLRWYASEPGGAIDEVDPIEEAADDLYLPATWLRTVESLLRDKGQVIFYGPPGTGKTFVAQRLAAALTRSDDDRWLVQFHPSTSYEDFFEGFRPFTDDGGQLSYELTAGPLARAASYAASHPGRNHVLVIDEINRANLPRVLGELLFLLEYRDRSIHTLYRAGQPFRLPPNLLIIGTMNTADRSIAMIDAALRRRFHFVPMFPHEPPLDGLLEDWGADNGLDKRWIALLAMVNAELVGDLGGPDLQVGPSHLMKPDLDADEVERIWTYSIFPYIEDQLFGRPDQIEKYRWPRVIARLDKQLAAEVAQLAEADVAPAAVPGEGPTA